MAENTSPDPPPSPDLPPAPRKRPKKAQPASKPTKQPASKPTKQAASKPTTQPASRSAEDADPMLTGPAAVPAVAPRVPGAASPVAPGAWAAAAWSAVRQPDQPPQQLAELAVAELGPRAAAWLAWLRRTYPQATADGIARLAARQAGRSGRRAALLGAGGPVAAAISLPAAGWAAASVVLRIAAAYGHDPADPRRVPELLDLLGLAPAEPDASSGWVGALARRLGRLPFRSIALRPRRVLPLVPLQLVFGAGEAGDQMDRLAYRAVRHYRPGSQASTDASAASSSSR